MFKVYILTNIDLLFNCFSNIIGFVDDGSPNGFGSYCKFIVTRQSVDNRVEYYF